MMKSLHNYILGVALALSPMLISVTARADEPVVIRVAAFPCTHCIQPWLLPDYMQGHNVKIELIRMRRYQDIQVALATNNADFGNIGYSSIPLLAANGISNVKLVSGISEGGQGLMLKPGIEAEKWSDLQGLHIGVSPNSVSELLFKSTVSHAGTDLGSIGFVSFTTMGPEVLQAVKSGEIDGFVGWEPTQALAALDGVTDYSDLKLEDGPAGNLNGVLAVTDQFREKYPQVTEQVVEAMVAITNDLNADKAKWVTAATPFSGNEAATKLGTEHSILSFEMPARRVAELANILIESGVVKVSGSLNVRDYLDYSYLAKATGRTVEELGGD